MHYVGGTSTWIGGYDRDESDIFYWVDNTQLEDGYTNWAGNNPTHGSENYVAIGNTMSTNGEWYDFTRTGKHFLCEKSATIGQSTTTVPATTTPVQGK